MLRHTQAAMKTPVPYLRVYLLLLLTWGWTCGSGDITCTATTSLTQSTVTCFFHGDLSQLKNNFNVQFYYPPKTDSPGDPLTASSKDYNAHSRTYTYTSACSYTHARACTHTHTTTTAATTTPLFVLAVMHCSKKPSELCYDGFLQIVIFMFVCLFVCFMVCLLAVFSLLEQSTSV